MITHHVQALPEAIPLDIKQTLVASLATTLELLDANGNDVGERARFEAARAATERALAWVRSQPTKVDAAWFPSAPVNE